MGEVVGQSDEGKVEEICDWHVMCRTSQGAAFTFGIEQITRDHLIELMDDYLNTGDWIRGLRYRVTLKDVCYLQIKES